MEITQLIDEDIINYKKCSMFIGTSKCNFKCCIENNLPISVCQNYKLNNNIIKFDNVKLIERYLSNKLTESIVFGGLEPIDTFDSLYEFIELLRCEYGCNDDIVIYTGYNKNEILDKIKKLLKFSNIYIKFGRYIPNQKSHYDSVLGVNLASDNQYAERIS